jgi:hypothetical protein
MYHPWSTVLCQAEEQYWLAKRDRHDLCTAQEEWHESPINTVEARLVAGPGRRSSMNGRLCSGEACVHWYIWDICLISQLRRTVPKPFGLAVQKGHPLVIKGTLLVELVHIINPNADLSAKPLELQVRSCLVEATVGGAVHEAGGALARSILPTTGLQR